MKSKNNNYIVNKIRAIRPEHKLCSLIKYYLNFLLIEPTNLSQKITGRTIVSKQNNNNNKNWPIFLEHYRDENGKLVKKKFTKNLEHITQDDIDIMNDDDSSRKEANSQKFISESLASFF